MMNHGDVPGQMRSGVELVGFSSKRMHGTEESARFQPFGCDASAARAAPGFFITAHPDGFLSVGNVPRRMHQMQENRHLRQIYGKLRSAVQGVA
jgi:hypothetical protein